MSTELKPCPFCGGEAERKHAGYIGEACERVRCAYCHVSTGRYRVRDGGAVATWNRRAVCRSGVKPWRPSSEDIRRAVAAWLEEEET